MNKKWRHRMGRRSLLVPHRKGQVMEPLINDSEAGASESKTQDQKVKLQVDRVTLNKDESEKIKTKKPTFLQV